MKYYISDLHFGHRSAIDFDSRPFSDVEEMDRVLIENWNSRVTKNDQVYILGDFAFHNEKPYSWYLEQLAGQKHLIIGNHDRKLLKDSEAMSHFVSVDHYLEVTDEKKRIILSHYPIAEWRGFHRESWQIYGHIHSRTDATYQYMKQFDRVLNAAACINNYIPASFNELVRNNEIFKKSYEDSKKRTAEMERLAKIFDYYGIPFMVFDGPEVAVEVERDRIEASLLIRGNKPVPKELEERLLSYKKEQNVD